MLGTNALGEIGLGEIKGLVAAPTLLIVGGFARVHHPLPRLQTIKARLNAKERGDTCESTAMLGFDPVAMDNDWLLVAG